MPHKSSLKALLNEVPLERLEAFVFGSGDNGELGLGPKVIDSKVPRLNSKLSGKVVQIALGGMHGVALTADNQILTWGVNDRGALGRDTKWDSKMKDIDAEEEDDVEDDGDNVNPYESNPIPIPSTSFPRDTLFAQVAAGDSTTFALTDDGLVYGWGLFRVGMLRNATRLALTLRRIAGAIFDSTLRTTVLSRKMPSHKANPSLWPG